MILSRFDDAAAAAAALAGQVAGTLREGLATRGAASLVVPGGRTPLPFFTRLREAGLDWSRVGITLSDERWVRDGAPGSNAALVRDVLLQGPAGAARFVPLYDGSGSAAAAVSVWQQLESLPRPFDAVVLGMGEDGHFASLFAGNAQLATALDMQAPPGCVAMRAPVAPFERLSLNLSALTDAGRLFLLVAGEAKLELLQRAAQGAAGEDWPVSALLAQQGAEAEVFWSP